MPPTKKTKRLTDTEVLTKDFLSYKIQCKKKKVKQLNQSTDCC